MAGNVPEDPRRAASAALLLLLRRRMRKIARSATRARRTTTPITMPAMAPPEREEFGDADGVLLDEGPVLLAVEPLELAGSAFKVLDHVVCQLGGFLAAVIVVSVYAIFCTFGLRKSGPGACARNSLFVCQLCARKAA